MHQRSVLLSSAVTLAAASLALSGCSSSTSSSSPTSASASPSPSSTSAEITPVLGNTLNAPVPFLATDGNNHLVYEIELTNFSSGTTVIDSIDVLDNQGNVVESLSSADVAASMQLFGERESTGTLTPSSSAIVFFNIPISGDTSIPTSLEHRVTATVEAAPEGTPPIVTTVAPVDVSTSTAVITQPPLRGEGYVSADSCCDSARHRKAALPINNQIWIAQRYAVDWEQIDDENKIFSGSQQDVTSYTIYGKDVFAVADATVSAAVDEFPDQIPPTVKDVTIENADGNHVILDLGDGKYALYAHLAPGTVQVKPGDTVKAGDVLGKVGNSGNSIAPHLHFHVMDSSNALASNGFPSVLSQFTVTGRVTGDTPEERTAAFDAAEANGTPLPFGPSPYDGVHTNQYPLNQLIVSMG